MSAYIIITGSTVNTNKINTAEYKKYIFMSYNDKYNEENKKISCNVLNIKGREMRSVKMVAILSIVIIKDLHREQFIIKVLMEKRKSRSLGEQHLGNGQCKFKEPEVRLNLDTV